MTMATQQVQVSAAYARKLTESIRRTAVNAKEDIDKLNELIVQAKNGNAHLALGYKSWTAYLSDTLSETPMLLERDARQAFVAQLASEGMSTRAIAPIVGVDKDTVRRDIQHGVNTPPAELVADPETGEVLDAPVTTEHTITEKTKTTTGLDGKTYSRPEPSAPRRSSLIDDARNAGWQLRKAIERLERIHTDDRFSKNKVEVMAALQPHLDLANEVLSNL